MFTSAVSGSEKGGKALFYLRNNLNKLLEPFSYDLGIFLVSYSKQWFRLFLILEFRAQEYISWVANTPETSTNYRKILSDLKNLFKINYSIIDEKNKFYSVLKLELEGLENQVTVESANKLRNLIQNTLRMYLTNDDYKEKLQFIAFFISKSFKNEVTIQELIHEFAKDWFRKSLEFKKWFFTVLEKLEKPENIEIEYRMFKGYNWMKLEGRPLKSIISAKRKQKIAKTP